MKYRTKAKLKARKRICPANFARQKTKMAAADLPVGPSNTSLSEQLPAQEPSSTPQSSKSLFKPLLNMRSSKSLFKPLLNMSGEKINRSLHVHTIKKRNISSTVTTFLKKKQSPGGNSIMDLKLLSEAKRLTSDELLERCKKGMTQNQNEAINGILWNRCPVCGKRKLELAVSETVAEFNRGALARVSLQADCGINISENQVISAQKQNDVRVKNAARKVTERARLVRRKARCKQKAKLDSMKGQSSFK